MSNYRTPDRHQPPSFNRSTYLGTAKSDLERDSGFSDASSEYLSAVELTDSEDAGRKEPLVVQDPAAVHMALMGGSYSNLPPMIIMNNFVLKQPPQAAAEKQWSFPSPLESMPQSQVVLLQPVVPDCNGVSTKTVPEQSRQSKVPAPKSYPRIAPHPGDVPTKRSGSSRMKGSSSAYEQRRHHHHHHGHYRSASPQTQPSAASSEPADIFEVMNSQTSQAQTQLDQPTLTSVVTPNPQERFSNTYNILNKCGLLGITMRTKQLIQDNKRTQGQLQQLQAQTELLLQALDSGDPHLWTKLQLSLQDAGEE
ncbi:CLOCK-interacting pacemaker a [Synchiropus picturatus]